MSSQSISGSYEDEEIYYSCNSSLEDLSHISKPEDPSVSNASNLAQSNMQKKKQEHFSFLELPAEIRNLIYDRVIIDHSLDTQQTSYVFHLKSHVGRDVGFFPPRLACASKQTRSECLSLLFAKEGSSININFTFEGRMNAKTKRWIQGLPATVKIQRLYVFFTVPESYRACDRYYAMPAVCLETGFTGASAMNVVLKFKTYRRYGFGEEGWKIASYAEEVGNENAAEYWYAAEEWRDADEQITFPKQEVHEKRRFVGKKLAAALCKEMKRNASPGIGMKELKCLRRKMEELGCLHIPNKL